jgi:uncharacterized hydrophobic protein (TIGR00271 family)
MQNVSNSTLIDAHKKLRERATFDFDHIFLMIASSVICFFGFKMNSVAIIIGAMIISPLLYTIVSVSSSFIYADIKILIKKIVALLVELLVVIAVAFALGNIFTIEIASEITDRLSYSYLDYFYVALFSGIAGAFAVFWPKIIETLTGIAISVALIPPVIILGIGLALWDMQIVSTAFDIVWINLLGISLGAVLLILALRILVKIKK